MPTQIRTLVSLPRAGDPGRGGGGYGEQVFRGQYQGDSVAVKRLSPLGHALRYGPLPSPRGRSHHDSTTRRSCVLGLRATV